MEEKVELAHHTNQHKLSWQLINNLTGKKNAKKGIIKGNDKQDRLSKWYEYFKNLLRKESIIPHPDEEIRTIFDNLDIPSGQFTMDGYHKVKQKLVKGKATGPDGIPPEVSMLADIDDIILKFENNLLLNLEKPAQWSTSHIQPIPKTGDLSEVGNYRGIAISPTAAKITNNMLLNCIQPILDPPLRPNQNGFRPRRSTTSHILALRRIIEGVKSYNFQVAIILVHFKKASDSIHRHKMLGTFRKYGVPRKLVDAIGKFYESTFASVSSPDGETDFFQIQAGVLQGDISFPLCIDCRLCNEASSRWTC